MELPKPLHTTGDKEERVHLAPNLSIFTADQMRAYGELCARLAREEAAKIAEDYANEDGFRLHLTTKIAAAIRSQS